MRIDKPGLYDMPAEDYHADPCVVPSLSSSIAKVLTTATPHHAWTEHPRLNPGFKRDEKEIFDLGNAAHALILHDAGNFQILSYNDWKTKEAQQNRDKARAEGRVPILEKHWDRVVAMVESGRAQLHNHQDAGDAFRDGRPEQTLVWKEGDTWFRIRPDWTPNTIGNGTIFDDYKSSGSADPDAFQRVCYSIGHDIQAALYRRGIRAVFGIEDPRFRFIVQETEAPFALSAIELSPEALELADMKLERAIDRWRWCMEKNIWPGYPATTCIIGAPAWHESQILARHEADAAIARQAGIKPTAELLALAIKWQAPII